MRKRLQGVTVFCLLAAGAMTVAGAAMAAGTERYLHVKVEDGDKGESVNVNVPLSMAEKILPTINNHDLHQGRVSIHDAKMEDIDLRTILDAVRSAEDNEFVTVKEKDQDVRVAKSHGNIIVHIKDNRNKEEKVDVTVPMKVIDALLSNTKNNELDISAALRALSDAGDILLVTVQDAGQKVRVWVDSRNTQD
jgi:formylmethanofuran dehydrogenase subunit D